MQSRSARANPRSALLGALLFVVLAGGLYGLGPWILPVRILEGPMLQQTTESGTTLIWYTTRALAEGDCEVVITIDSQTDRTLPVEADGQRNRVRIDGLETGAAYAYRIQLGGRTLAANTLQTNQPAGAPFSFIVFGDSGKGTQAQYLLADQMRAPALAPNFLLHTGDLVYGQGERRDYKDRFFAPYRHLLAEIDFWPCLGNHDIKTDDGQPYVNVFELPENGPPGLPAERSYWFDYASARVAVIDSNPGEAVLAKHVAPWLEEVMTDCDATWKFVSLHHPPYTAGSYKPDLNIQRALVPVFEATGVDVVFCGHDHLYQRMHAIRGGEVVADGDGVVYIVTGAGGGRLYDALPEEQRPAYVAALNDQRHSFTYVQIDGHELRLQQIDVRGDVIDEWALGKTLAGPATQPGESNSEAGEPGGGGP